MRNRPLLAWALLGTTLLLVIGLEVIDGPEEPVASLLALRRTMPAVAGAGLTEPNRDWTAQSLARPLFSPDRRPVPEAAGAGLLGPPRLSGIMITPAGRSAIFVAGGRQLVLQLGGAIGAYTVQSIDEQQVLMSGPAGPLLLRPSFSPEGTVTGARAAGGTAAAFNAEVAPSGLDILRNAARQAPADGGVAPRPGVDQTGAAALPAQPRNPVPVIPNFAAPPGSPGAPPPR